VGRQRAARRLGAKVDLGLAELVADPDRAQAYLLLIDGAPQSHVDLDDPAHLEFEYVRRIAAAVDLTAPPAVPLRVLHLGGGGMTLARYISATRPGSRQRVVERDVALVALVRRLLPLPADPRLKVRVGDARTEVEKTPNGAYDLVICDVFAGARTPASVRSREFVGHVARVLAPGGRYVANLTDGAPLTGAKEQIATAADVFAHRCVVADASVWRGRRYGNLVLTASNVPLPTDDLNRRAAGDWFPGRLLCGAELDRFVAGVKIVTDATAEPSAPPPVSMFSRPVE
jgi:spermidine synthase